MPLNTPNQIESALKFKFFAASMGKIFRVMAICKTADEANRICEQKPELAVISEDQDSGLIFLAEKYGAKLPAETLKKLLA